MASVPVVMIPGSALPFSSIRQALGYDNKDNHLKVHFSIVVVVGGLVELRETEVRGSGGAGESQSWIKGRKCTGKRGNMLENGRLTPSPLAGGRGERRHDDNAQIGGVS